MNPQPVVAIQGQGAVGADALNTYVQTCFNFAQLRSFTGLGNMAVYVLGGVAPGDGLQGLFYFNSSSTAADNNGSVIVPFGATQGAWLADSPIEPTPYSFQEPMTGFSIAFPSAAATGFNSFPAGTVNLILNPAGTLASGTVTTPVGPVDQQTIVISSTQIITAFTLAGAGSAAVANPPTTLVAGGVLRYQYVAGQSTWFRV